MVLGGGKKRKNLRTIEIDREKYYWRLVDDEKVTIGLVARPHCRVVLTESGGLSSTYVTPRMIREAILFARSIGWPHERATLAVEHVGERFSVSATRRSDER